MPRTTIRLSLAAALVVLGACGSDDEPSAAPATTVTSGDSTTTSEASSTTATTVPTTTAATGPPVSAPPATSPPATSPPATQPPATSPPATQPPAAAAGMVAIANFAFEPVTLMVVPGTTVTWVNNDDAAHTVKDTSKLGKPESPTMNRDATFSITYPTAGTYTYLCGIHQYMTGTVKVG